MPDFEMNNDKESMFEIECAEEDELRNLGLTVSKLKLSFMDKAKLSEQN